MWDRINKVASLVGAKKSNLIELREFKLITAIPYFAYIL